MLGRIFLNISLIVLPSFSLLRCWFNIVKPEAPNKHIAPWTSWGTEAQMAARRFLSLFANSQATHTELT